MFPKILAPIVILGLAVLGSWKFLQNKNKEQNTPLLTQENVTRVDLKKEGEIK